MSNDKLFSVVLERIARAKKKPAFKTFSKFRDRVENAEKMLGLGYVKVAEEMIDDAEKILYRHEILELSLDYGLEIRAQVRELLLLGKLDEAMSVVCS